MISVVVCVYNEFFLLLRGLKVIHDFVDEIIVMDGSPLGPSDIDLDDIAEVKAMEKVKYFSGAFGKLDGAWDEATQMNFAISQATQQYIMHHECDILYNVEDMEMLEKAICDNPDRTVFYNELREFWLSEKYIRVYDGEPIAYKSPCTHKTVIAKDIKPHHNGIQLTHRDVDKAKNFMYVPDCTSYHYGFIKGFQAQIDKHIRNLKMGLWGEPLDAMKANKDIEQVKWALKLTRGYPDEDCRMPYSGDIPACMEGLSMTYMDGYEKAMDALALIYGDEIREVK